MPTRRTRHVVEFIEVRHDGFPGVATRPIGRKDYRPESLQGGPGGTVYSRITRCRGAASCGCSGEIVCGDDGRSLGYRVYDGSDHPTIRRRNRALARALARGEMHRLDGPPLGVDDSESGHIATTLRFVWDALGFPTRAAYIEHGSNRISLRRLLDTDEWRGSYRAGSDSRADELVTEAREPTNLHEVWQAEHTEAVRRRRKLSKAWARQFVRQLLPDSMIPSGRREAIVEIVRRQAHTKNSRRSAFQTKRGLAEEITAALVGRPRDAVAAFKWVLRENPSQKDGS